MDPLTALGLASNVFSFVSFASGLIKGTIEISVSATGCSIDVTRLDAVCEQLQNLCDGLQSCTDHNISGAHAEDHVAKVFLAVKSLCVACKTDGDELLKITKTLRTKNGSKGKWDSFIVSLKQAWKKSSIDELEARLSQTQVGMTVHICTLGYYCSRDQSKRLEYLQQRSLSLQADQAKTLKQISDGLNDLENRLQSQHQRGNFTMGDVDCLQEKLQSLSLSGNDVKKQQSILESLTFESRPIRHAQIAAAHEKTFTWALTTNQNPTLGPSIGTWLRQGDGIFWVSGKPGSGKSTLMKYIANSDITSRFISEWAQPCRAAIISHYFWITGTSMQKSQQGLLQTLLYEIFRQCPDLIEQTCVERWNSPQSGDSWSLVELRETLQTFVARDHASLKLCFFIDGLDEYSGDYEDRIQLCRTLKGLAKPGNVKLCLSSRPWNIFEEEFGLEFPKLYMQDLTREDIQNYVLSRLKEHTRWAAVSANHSQGQWLVSEIAAKSNGVFLWVFLVTKLLREGLTNRDAFVDLRRRLESFPSELEPFFKTMLEAVEPFYHSHMSTALQIANASTERQMSFLVYSFHFQEYEDSDYAINHPIGLMNKTDIDEIRSNTSWHLDSRTRGLLEINPEDGNVYFLHRTARDFLNTQEMHEFLVAKADPRLNFCPALSTLKAHIAMIKTSSVPDRITRKRFGVFEAAIGSSEDSVPDRITHGLQLFGEFTGSTEENSVPDRITPEISEVLEFEAVRGGKDSKDEQHIMLMLVWQALSCAREIESEMTGDIRHRALLDELDRSLLCLLSRGNCIFDPRDCSNMKQAFLREQLVGFGLFDYLRNKLDSEPAFLKNIGALPVLDLLLPGQNEDIHPQRRLRTDVLVCLLDNRGMDPNKEGDCQGISPWNELLARICDWWIRERKGATHFLSYLLEAGILKLFLKAGADPSALIAGPSTTSGTYGKAATVVYLEFCFEVLDQSPPIQALYLDVLSEFFRLSSNEVLRNTTNEFCTVLTNKDKEELHWNLPFLTKVNNMLRLSLRSRGPGTVESLQSLDEMGKRVFPLDLFTPEPRRRKRKQESGSGQKRKNLRKE